MGKAGSGKDSFVTTLIQGGYIPNSKPIISCTTRPIRENEIDGVNYHYLTNEEFTNQVLNGKMLEATIFNNWCYGTSIDNLDINAINIGVFNPEGIEILQTNQNIDLSVLYLTASDKTRLLRQLMREEEPNCKEIVRRFGTDEKDFREERIKAISPEYTLQNDSGITLESLAKTFTMIYSSGQNN